MTTSGGGVVIILRLKAPILSGARCWVGWVACGPCVCGRGARALCHRWLCRWSAALLQHDEDAALSSRLGRLCVYFPVLLALTMLGVIGMAAGGDGFVASFCMALSGISGTGTSVVSGSVYDAFSCSRNCLGNFVHVQRLKPARHHSHDTDAIGETLPRNRVQSAACHNYQLCCDFWLTQGGESYFALVFQAISLATTAGFNFLPADRFKQLAGFMGHAAGFIGGMGLSMAGGIKINRAILVGRELASDCGVWLSVFRQRYAYAGAGGLIWLISAQHGPIWRYSF